MTKEEKIIEICKIKASARQWMQENNKSVKDFVKSNRGKIEKSILNYFMMYIKTGDFNHIK